MSQPGEQILLRAYLDSDRTTHTPSYERLVAAAQREKLAGCTVLKGIAGFGPHGPAKKSAWTLVEHVPVVVEVIDRAERIVEFLETTVGAVIAHGLVTLERAHVMMYRRSSGTRQPLALGPPLAPLSTVPKPKATSAMQTNDQGVLLRVFIGERDRYEKQPLYEAILRKARELGLGGATVLRGVEGFGAHSVVHKAGLLEMSTDLPIIVEIVAAQDQVQTLLPHLDAMVAEGMITMEYVVVLTYREGSADH